MAGRTVRRLPLLVLVLVAGAMTVHLATRPDPTAVEPEVTGDSYHPGTLPSDAGEGAVKAAVRAVPLALSYDYRSLDEGLVDATALMTDEFRAEFTEVFTATTRDRALEKEAVTSTLIRGAGLVRLEGSDEAFCLVYVDQVLVDSETMKNGDQPMTVARNRVLVGLERVHGDWLVNSMEPF